MSAPYNDDIADGPKSFDALWRIARDGVRLRVCIWANKTAKGTILLFPGRTEVIEKYGIVANDLVRSGYSVASIDWRGQGHSDRLADDALLGHVGAFSDYQLDVAELVAAAREANLPKPWFLMCHSLGGCIGLRALIEGLPVERAVFSAPMWDIFVPWHKRPLAMCLPFLARQFGKSLSYLPGQRQVYVLENGFENNELTSDPIHFARQEAQIKSVPALALAGPSIHWFGQARAEAKRLACAPRPTIPVRTYLGTDEWIVSPQAIKAMHKDWPSATLHMVQGARHELFMEVPELRAQVMDGAGDFFGEVG